MTDHGSNQYPRLRWERNPDMVHGGFIARPHGPEAGWARVYYDRSQLSLDKDNHEVTYWWVWSVVWRERFATSGYVAATDREQAKQEAADKATVAYWDRMEATEGWRPAPKVVPYIDLAAFYFWQRVERWFETITDLEIYSAQWDRYRMAATVGPTIISKEDDQRMARRFSDRSWSVKSRIMWPEYYPARR